MRWTTMWMFVACAGCFEQGASSSLITCTSDDECSSGTCLESVGLCARTNGAPIDDADPVVLNAEFAGPPPCAELRLNISEPLADASDLELLTTAFILPEVPNVSAADPTLVTATVCAPADFLRGTIVARSIVLTDVAGNVSTAVLNAAWEVDQAAPRIMQATFHDELDDGQTVFAPQGPASRMTVTVDVDDPDAIVLMTVAGSIVNCVDSSTLRHVCTHELTDVVASGVLDARVAAMDLNGNLWTEPFLQLFDSVGPAPLIDSVRLSRRSAAPGAEVSLSVFANEPFVDARVWLGTNEATTTSTNGSLLAATLVVPLVQDAQALPVRVEWRDAFGNQASHALGSVVVERAPCVAPPTRDACFDLDNDGFVGARAGCGVVDVDCNDANPIVYPGSIDVPGNGADENCDGFDEQPDERHGYVADCGQGEGDGSLTTPFPTLAAANDADSYEVLLLDADASASLGADDVDNLAATLIGGWTGICNGTPTYAGAQRTRVSILDIVSPRVFRGHSLNILVDPRSTDIGTGIYTTTLTLQHSAADVVLSANGDSRIASSDVTDIQVGGRMLLADVRANALSDYESVSSLFIDRSDISTVYMNPGNTAGRVLITNTTVASLYLYGTTDVHMVHSLVQAAVPSVVGASTLTIENSVLSLEVIPQWAFINGATIGLNNTAVAMPLSSVFGEQPRLIAGDDTRTVEGVLPNVYFEFDEASGIPELVNAPSVVMTEGLLDVTTGERSPPQGNINNLPATTYADRNFVCRPLDGARLGPSEAGL
jgi:hypothetical protein